MKPLHIIMATAALCLGAACTKNEFNIEVELQSHSTSDYQVTYYASDSKRGFYMGTNIVVSNGRGSLRGVTRNPTLVYIQGRGNSLPLVLYAERGEKLILRGDNADPLTWSVTGNKLDEEWAAWRLEHSRTLTSGVSDSINAAVAQYVEAAPDGRLAPLLLLTAFDRNADDALYRRLWQMLPASTRGGKMVQLVSRSDQLVPYADAPARLGSLVLRGRGRLDTLKSADVKATLLLVRGSNREGATGRALDSLRVLSRQYRDSTRRHIADIATDPDSVSWMAPLRTDSLRRVVRAWRPLGEADPSLRQLGVRRLPYWLVYDSVGSPVYTGPDAAKALAAFRKLND